MRFFHIKHAAFIFIMAVGSFSIIKADQQLRIHLSTIKDLDDHNRAHQFLQGAHLNADNNYSMYLNTVEPLLKRLFIINREERAERYAQEERAWQDYLQALEDQRALARGIFNEVEHSAGQADEQVAEQAAQSQALVVYNPNPLAISALVENQELMPLASMIEPLNVRTNPLDVLTTLAPQSQPVLTGQNHADVSAKIIASHPMPNQLSQLDDLQNDMDRVFDPRAKRSESQMVDLKSRSTGNIFVEAQLQGKDIKLEELLPQLTHALQIIENLENRQERPNLIKSYAAYRASMSESENRALTNIVNQLNITYTQLTDPVVQTTQATLKLIQSKLQILQKFLKNVATRAQEKYETVGSNKSTTEFIPERVKRFFTGIGDALSNWWDESGKELDSAELARNTMQGMDYEKRAAQNSDSYWKEIMRAEQEQKMIQDQFADYEMMQDQAWQRGMLGQELAAIEKQNDVERKARETLESKPLSPFAYDFRSLWGMPSVPDKAQQVRDQLMLEELDNYIDEVERIAPARKAAQKELKQQEKEYNAQQFSNSRDALLGGFDNFGDLGNRVDFDDYQAASIPSAPIPATLQSNTPAAVSTPPKAQPTVLEKFISNINKASVVKPKKIGVNLPQKAADDQKSKKASQVDNQPVVQPQVTSAKPQIPIGRATVNYFKRIDPKSNETFKTKLEALKAAQEQQKANPSAFKEVIQKLQEHSVVDKKIKPGSKLAKSKR